MTLYSHKLSLITLLLAGMLFLPSPAFAYYIGANCDGYNYYQFTSAVVSCMENAITNATFTMMNGIASYMFYPTSVMLTLAIAFFGIRLATGERHVAAYGASIMIRIGLITMFLNSLGFFASYIFAIENELTALAFGGYSPWNFIDEFLGKLMGFGQNIYFFQGILGLVGSSLFSASVGLLMFMSGFAAIIKLLMFIFDVVYTYISALILIGFLLLLSPIVIPLGIFFYTERYLTTWLHVLWSVMLMPVLLFGFLWMFIGLFSILVNDVFYSLGGNDFRGYWQHNTPKYSWLMPAEPNLTQHSKQIALTTPEGSSGKITPPVQSYINPGMSYALNASPTSLPGFLSGNTANLTGVNFGVNAPQMVQNVGFSLIAIFIFSAIMSNMLNSIPFIARSIAGVTTSVPFFSGSPTERIQAGMDNFKTGAGALIGGMAGGAIGGAAGQLTGGRNGAAVGRGVGAIVGGVAGAVSLRRNNHAS